MPHPPDTLNVFDVIRLAQKALEVARAHSSLNLRREEVTVEEMFRWLGERLGRLKPDEALDGTALFQEQTGVDRKILLFLTLLEMARLGSVRLCQEIPLGKLSVTRPAHAAPAYRSAALEGGR